MRDMVMHMSGSNGILSVPDEHLPGLIALVLIGPVLWLALSGLRTLSARHVPWAERLEQRIDALPLAGKVVLIGTLVGAVVHAVIVPTHWGDVWTTAILFIADTVGFAVVTWWVLTMRPHWRLASAALLGGTAGAYALYILMGWETMDLVGLLTTTVEAAAALIVLSPSTVPARQRSVVLAVVPVALFSLLGTSVIASASTSDSSSSSATPAATPAASSAPAPASGSSSAAMPNMSVPSTPGGATAPSLATTSPAGPITWPDDMSAMAAGMKMAEPNCNAQPTAAEQQAAVALVDQTVAAARKYQSLDAAKAAGYVPITQPGKKVVHYINPALYRQSGGAVDPAAIPALVYVNTADGAVLSAAMYLDPAGKTPPQPGGCLTQWHIHTDLCFSGSGQVVGADASSACATGSVNRVTPPMMHVWLTSVPGGPLAPDPPAAQEVRAAAQLPVLPTPNGTA